MVLTMVAPLQQKGQIRFGFVPFDGYTNLLNA